MKSISIVNLKGGVGKTVTAVNLAGILAADYGKRVLLVDSDPQGDASQYIGVAPDACSTADLFDGGTAYYEDVIQHTIYRDLDIIPSDMQLASVDLDADIDRKQAVRVYADLRDALVEDDAYDVMIFDCPPSFSLPCISAIAASDTVIVPIKPGAFEMSGMRLLADQIASVRNTGLAKRSVFGLLTIWHNADATRQSEDWLREHSPIPLFYRKIRRTDKVTESTYLRRGAETIETALQAQRYEANYYKNGGQVSGVLATETDLSSKTRFDENGNAIDLKNRIRENWESIHSGADNAFRIAVLDQGLKYTPLTATNRDAQFIETKAASVEDIARLFNIPFYKLGAGKESYAANTQAAIEYMQRTLSPIVSEHEQEDTHKLLLESESARGLQLRRNMMGELRGDWSARGAWYQTMHQNGVYSVNDIRALEDLPDVPGGGDRLASLNYVPLEDFRELSRSRNGGGNGREGGE